MVACVTVTTHIVRILRKSSVRQLQAASQNINKRWHGIILTKKEIKINQNFFLYGISAGNSSCWTGSTFSSIFGDGLCFVFLYSDGNSGWNGKSSGLSDLTF